MGAGDQDVITFGSSSASGKVINCLIDGGAAAGLLMGGVSGKDGIDIEGTGATSFANGIEVSGTEIRHCYDRALKSEAGYATLRDSWVHNNIRGGPFAQGSGANRGHLLSERNLLEHNGKNCPTMATAGLVAGRDPLTCKCGNPDNDCDGDVLRQVAGQIVAENDTEL